MILNKEGNILMLSEIPTATYSFTSEKPLPFGLVQEDMFKSNTRLYKSIVVDGKFYGVSRCIPVDEFNLSNMAEQLAHSESVVSVPNPEEQFFHFSDVDIWKAGWAEGFKYLLK